MTTVNKTSSHIMKIVIVLCVFVIFGASKKVKMTAFNAPQLIYSGHITGQSVIFNYSRYVSPKATQIQLCLFIIVGDDQKGKQLGWIKIENEVDFHYSAVWGNHQSTYFSWYGDTFTLQVTPTKTATLTANIAIGGLNNGASLYFTGYWQDNATSNLRDQQQ